MTVRIDGADLNLESIAKSGSSKLYGDVALIQSTGVNIAQSGQNVTFTTDDSAIDHDSLSNFVANEHIDHTGVTLTAGVGLSGGGTIAANRTFTVDLNELTTETAIASGDFIAMVDITDSGSGKVTLANLLKAAYPIGSIYMAVVSTNPATLLGFGTWAAFGAGRALVGLDGGDEDFDTAEETGGAKTHTLTTAEMPSHTHNFGNCGSSAGGGNNPDLRDATDVTTKETASTGSGSAHNNLQPYIVVYMWKRTA